MDTNGDIWGPIHHRMAQIARDLEKGAILTPEERKTILEERAVKLAREEKADERREVIEVVEFCLADERYCVECKYVREVYPLRSLTPIPGVPDFVLGIVSVRGEIISVVDLKRFFELPRKGLSDLDRLIILRHRNESREMEFAVLAEEVRGTMSLPLRGLQATLPTLTGVRADYLKGVTRDRLIVLDAPKLLADKRMTVQQEVE